MRIILYTILLIGFIIPLSAQEFTPLKDQEAFRKQLNEISETTESIVCDFVQKKHLSFLEEDIESSGKFFYKQENRLRWEYMEPYSYIVVINDENMVVNDEGNINEFNLQSNKMFQEISSMVNHSLRGDVLNIGEDFEYDLLESPDTYLVKLKPTDKKLKEYISGIDIYFGKQDLLVSSIIMRESPEDYTKINFSNRKINTGVEEGRFEVK